MSMRCACNKRTWRVTLSSPLAPHYQRHAAVCMKLFIPRADVCSHLYIAGSGFVNTAHFNTVELISYTSFRNVRSTWICFWADTKDNSQNYCAKHKAVSLHTNKEMLPSSYKRLRTFRILVSYKHPNIQLYLTYIRQRDAKWVTNT
jgi:hypothetical protein